MFPSPCRRTAGGRSWRMPDDARKRLETEAALKLISSIQKRQSKGDGRRWRLDVSLSTIAWQGMGVFVIGILVGLGLFILYRIILG